MGIEVHRQFFEGLADVMADVGASGFWPTTFVSEPTPTPAVHWHDCEVHGYVMQGSTWIIDGESREHIDMAPGDKLVLPAGALHAEGEAADRVVYIVAVPEPRSFADVFRLLPADDPARPR